MNNSTIYLFSETDPIIESSNNLTFAPYNLAYPLLDQHAAASGLNSDENKWDLIYDFTDTNPDGDKQIHFNILDPSEFSIIEKRVEGMEANPVQCFPLPQKYGGTAQDNDPNVKSDEMVFDIKTTTAADAQKIFDEQERRRAELEQANNPVIDNDDDEPQHDGK